METSSRKSEKLLSENIKEDSKSLNKQQLEDDTKAENSITKSISKSIGSVKTNSEKVDDDSKVERISTTYVESYRMNDEIKINENIENQNKIDETSFLSSTTSKEKLDPIRVGAFGPAQEEQGVPLIRKRRQADLARRHTHDRPAQLLPRPRNG